MKIGGLDLERTELILGIIMTCTAAGTSVAVALAVTTSKIEAHEKEIASSYDEVKTVKVQVNNIDVRTARMEGILEEMRRQRR